MGTNSDSQVGAFQGWGHLISRRKFLKRAAVLGAVVATSTSLLSACGGDSETPAPAGGSATESSTAESSTASSGATPEASQSSGDQGTSVASGDENATLKVAVQALPPNIDVTDAPTGFATVAIHVYRQLYKFSGDLSNTSGDHVTPEMDLLETSEVTPDGLHWNMRLKPGITFHDGTPVNAQAVQFSIQRMKDLKAPQAVLYAPITEVRPIDDGSFEIDTDGPFASLINNLATVNAAIISPQGVEQLGDRFGLSPVSCGPYMVSEWRAGEKVTLKRFPDYAGPKPYFETIEFSAVPNESTRISLVETGEADFAAAMPAFLVSKAKDNSDLQVIELEGTRLMYFWCNLDMPPMDNPDVREALSLAIDRDAIMKNVCLGSASPAHSLVGTVVQFSENVGDLSYDPERAKQLLEKAGGISEALRIISPDGKYNFDSATAQAVVGYWSKIGIEAKLETFSDGAAWQEAMGQRKHHLGLVGWGGSTGDPDQYLRRQLWGEIAGEPWNYAGYKNPRVDDLISQGIKVFDQEERAKIYKEIQEIIWNDRPLIALFRLNNYSFARANIQGIKGYVGGEHFNFAEARRA